MPEREDDIHLPENAETALRALFAGPGLPLDQDQAILQVAKAAGIRSRQQRLRWRIALGLAAAVALAATLWTLHNPQPKSDGSHGVDIAYRRTGDIRDAYYLARQLKAGHIPEGVWDVNHDGTIDEADVQALAVAAVKVDAGGVP